jgi:hypothetical protein
MNARLASRADRVLVAKLDGDERIQQRLVDVLADDLLWVNLATVFLDEATVTRFASEHGQLTMEPVVIHATIDNIPVSHRGRSWVSVGNGQYIAGESILVWRAEVLRLRTLLAFWMGGLDAAEQLLDEAPTISGLESETDYQLRPHLRDVWRPFRDSLTSSAKYVGWKHAAGDEQTALVLGAHSFVASMVEQSLKFRVQLHLFDKPSGGSEVVPGPLLSPDGLLSAAYLSFLVKIA